MYALAIIAALIFGGCLAAIQIRNWSSERPFWWMPDYGKELERTDRRLAIVAVIAFFMFIAFAVLATF